jgi:flagellar L-ring protein precursor FlgH
LKFKLLLLVCFLPCVLLADDLVDIDSFKPLTSDVRALVVGDAVTLIIYENAKASSSANKNEQGKFDLSVAANRDNIAWDYGLQTGSGSNGDAVTQRNGYIKAHITLLVTKVNENGLLNVSGEQKLTINGEQQTIIVQGRLRKHDISADNTAISSRLLDADISFTGEGTVSDGYDSNIFQRLYRWLGF